MPSWKRQQRINSAANKREVREQEPGLFTVGSHRCQSTVCTFTASRGSRHTPYTPLRDCAFLEVYVSNKAASVMDSRRQASLMKSAHPAQAQAIRLHTTRPAGIRQHIKIFLKSFTCSDAR
ncbi:unnamed protein product [Leuciscus chuanchicus]